MIYSYQKKTHHELVRTAAAYQMSLKLDLPVKPRFHKLIIGPTGTGKSHLAKKVADDLNWPSLVINVGGWVVLGGRDTPTFRVIGTWLADVPDDSPIVIVLDEIDKIWGSDSWTRYLRTELFSLLDGSFPTSVNSEEIEFAEKVKAKLRKAWIIGAGAFQDVSGSSSIGFNSSKNELNSLHEVSKHLQKELVNRFDSKVLHLPQLGREDYLKIAGEIKSRVPVMVRKLIDEDLDALVDEAVHNAQGARFAESLISHLLYRTTADTEPTPYKPPRKLVIDNYIPGERMEGDDDDEDENGDLQEVP